MSAVHVPVSYYIVCIEIPHVLHCHIYVYKKDAEITVHFRTTPV